VNGLQSTAGASRGSEIVKSEPGRRYVLSTSRPGMHAQTNSTLLRAPAVDRPTPPNHHHIQPESSSMFHVEFGSAASAAPPPTDLKFVRVNASWTA